MWNLIIAMKGFPLPSRVHQQNPRQRDTSLSLLQEWEWTRTLQQNPAAEPCSRTLQQNPAEPQQEMRLYCLMHSAQWSNYCFTVEPYLLHSRTISASQ